MMPTRSTKSAPIFKIWNQLLGIMYTDRLILYVLHSARESDSLQSLRWERWYHNSFFITWSLIFSLMPQGAFALPDILERENL